MVYRQYIGPRQAERKRRKIRQRIAAVIFVVLLFMVSSGTAPRDEKDRAPKQEPPSWMIATRSSIQSAANLYALNGDNGDAHVLYERWPNFQEYICGDKSLTELSDEEFAELAKPYNG